MNQTLTECLRELHLPGVLAGYENLAEVARRESFSYEKYLQEVVEGERQLRHEKRVQRLQGQSRLPMEKTLEAFDRGRLPVKVSAQLSRLLEGDFVQRRENVLAFGNPGSGKSHLLCALGACRTETTAEAGFRRVSSVYLNARGLAFYLCSVVDHHASCSPSWTVPSVPL
jgi:DNA replication protein DnaC